MASPLPPDDLDGAPAPDDVAPRATSLGDSPQALVRMLDAPPTVLPTLLLEDIVPFPGAVAPVLLDSPERREAIHQARQQSGLVLLVNRRPEPKIKPGEPLTPSQIEAVEGLVRLQAQQRSDAGDEEVQPGPNDESATVGHDMEPMFIGRSRGQKAKDRKDAKHTTSATLIEGSTPTVGHLSPVGVAARLIKVVRLPDDRLSALLQLFRRAQPLEVLSQEPAMTVRVAYPAEVTGDPMRLEAIFRQVRMNLQAFFTQHPHVGDDLKAAALSIETPGTVADFVAQHLSRDAEERLEFLTELDVTKRMKKALEVTLRELDLLSVGNRISQEIRDKVEKHQRDFLLREQLKSIRAELGEERDPTAMAIEELRARLDKAGLPKLVRSRADDELARLTLLPAESPEHNVVRSYLDWIACLPWSSSSPESNDIKRARAILDEDHFGLDEVKQRIIEFLAVHQLNPKKTGTLMCFAGPPGVGKTSLGQSIARALGRKFYRFSVGGMRDEAEIKGHRRTYIGAMPGRILQGLKQVGTNNCVFMLDELDKMGADWRGDPSSALLEVLDPAQNKSFSDHYLDLPFDLSRVMFIATANVHTEMPGPLRDRLEIIDLPGYIPEEKLEIARRYLLPRQRCEHGLTTKKLTLAQGGLRKIIRAYTQEAGVRELERVIAKICRKRALSVVTHEKTQAAVSDADLNHLLGAPKFIDDRLAQTQRPGVATGLAWTQVGGDVLFIEALAMKGKGHVKVTGQLGEVMNESASLAVAYVRGNSDALGIDAAWFAAHDLHLHFPAGAVKKDGPSAGITVTCALISLIINKPIVARLAMTGEITLRGEVLPVGGIREKIVAARRSGVKCVIVPERNRADVLEIPQSVVKNLKFVFASDFQQVLHVALPTKRALRPAS